MHYSHYKATAGSCATTCMRCCKIMLLRCALPPANDEVIFQDLLQLYPVVNSRQTSGLTCKRVTCGARVTCEQCAMRIITIMQFSECDVFRICDLYKLVDFVIQ